VIDFSKIGAGQPSPHFPFIPVRHQNPPSAGRYKTYGEWPNGRTQERPPTLLAGAHGVHGNYSPDIKFTLPPNRDYMPPLMIDAGTKTPAGATLIAWQPVAGATGYFAAMFGASPGKEGDATIIMWSSSAQQTFAGGGLLDYLAPGQVKRLIGQKAVMPSEQTKCAIPAEVTSGAPIGMLSMIAYGEETNFADPPRPADQARYPSENSCRSRHRERKPWRQRPHSHLRPWSAAWEPTSSRPKGGRAGPNCRGDGHCRRPSTADRCETGNEH